MLLPWQRTFRHCPKMCNAHLYFKANMCAKFHFKCFKNVEVVQSAMFSPKFVCHYAITVATHILPLLKNVSCTSTPQGKHLCQIP